MTLKLPRATDPTQARHNQALEANDLNNRKVGADVELTGERLILRSPNGTRTQIVVSNAGFVSAGPAPVSGSIAPATALPALDGSALTGITPSLSHLTNSLAADVPMGSIGVYFAGPSVAQGTTGTHFAEGTVTVLVPGSAANLFVKLWDGTTVIASARTYAQGGGNLVSVSLSGYLASPAANIRISVKDNTNATSSIVFNSTGESKDSTLSVVRIG